MMDLEELEHNEKSNIRNDDMIWQIAATTGQSGPVSRAINNRAYNEPGGCVSYERSEDINALPPWYNNDLDNDKVRLQNKIVKLMRGRVGRTMGADREDASRLAGFRVRPSSFAGSEAGSKAAMFAALQN